MSTIISIALIPLLLWGAFIKTKVPLSFYWDWYAFLFILTSCILTTSVSYGFSRIYVLLQLFYRRVLLQKHISYKDQILTILNLSRAKRVSENKFKQFREAVKDPFLKDVSYLLDWAETEVNSDQFRELLEVKARTFLNRYQFEVSIFESFSLLPVKFGLLYGSISATGIVFLGGEKFLIHIALIKFLIPTIYGMIFTYLFLKPMSRNLKDSVQEDQTARNLVIDGIYMIHKNLAPHFIEEKMQSFLLPKERITERHVPK